MRPRCLEVDYILDPGRDACVFPPRIPCMRVENWKSFKADLESSRLGVVVMC